MWGKTSRKCNLWLQHQLTCRWRKRWWKRSATISPTTPRLHKPWTGIRLGKEPKNRGLTQKPHTETSRWRRGVGGSAGRQLQWWSTDSTTMLWVLPACKAPEHFPCSLELWYCGLRAQNLILVPSHSPEQGEEQPDLSRPLTHLLLFAPAAARLCWLSAASFSQHPLPALSGQ